MTVQKIYLSAELQRVTGLRKSTIYDRMQKGTFPKPIKIGENRVGWLENDIAEWQSSLIKQGET